MPVNATSAAAPSPLVFAGFPASSWTFALRVWLAMMLALYASFWLELESPSSAALTVAILALPTRGQGMEKAGYRLLATAIGVMASIAIAGVFSQTDGLLLAVLGIWVGLCVYVAAMLDGNRAYAAALGCITVALIAIQQIDTPLQVFPTGIARGAAIGIGVLAVALVNEVLAAPDYHPVLAGRIEALYDRVKAHTHGTDRDSAVAAASLLHDIAAIRPEIASLTTESSIGTARTAAARSALVDLVSLLSLGRMLAALPVTSASAQSANGPDQKAARLTAISRSWLRSEISHKLAQVRSSLDALHQGVRPYHAWRAPLYRSRRIAAETGARAAISFALIGLFFVLTGWPTTELCLSLVAVILGLGSTAPAPRTFTKVTVMAMPIACALAGILKYFVFNGVSDFQLLAIGLAPVVIGFALLISSPNPLPSSLGRLTLVFTIAVLAPTNPQNYDPEVFLVTSFFACLSSLLVLAAQTLLPPLSGDQRVRLLLREATSELGQLDRWRVRDLAPEEAAFRDAGRVEQILSANGASALNGQIAAKAMRCFDQAESLRRCRAELERLTQGPLARVVQDARDALAQRNGAAILAAAEALSKAASQNNLSANSAIAALIPASTILAPSQSPTDPSQGKQP